MHGFWHLILNTRWGKRRMSDRELVWLICPGFSGALHRFLPGVLLAGGRSNVLFNLRSLYMHRGIHALSSGGRSANCPNAGIDGWATRSEEFAAQLHAAEHALNDACDCAERHVQ